MSPGQARKLCLYVDESGDFQSRRGEWVLAGLLLEAPFATAEEALRGAVEPVMERFSLPSLRECHLTEIRERHGHREACRFASEVLEAVRSALPAARFLTAVNETKRQVASAERTYRLMLLDLLSLADTALGGHVRVDRLDLVVATRTAQGEPLSTASEIDEQVLRSLPGVMEAELASRGLVDLAAENSLQLHLEPASSVWGLMVADFLANLTYNRRYPESRACLERFEEARALRCFVSLGGHEVRRARVAERDGDHIGAIHRWACLDTKRCSEEQRESLVRLWRHVLKHEGNRGPRATLEAVIERLHGTCRDSPAAKAGVLDSLLRLEESLSEARDATTAAVVPELLVRLRNYGLLLATQLGDVARAESILERQRADLPELVRLPEGFRLMLDFRPLEIETHLIRLDLVRAAELASDYEDLMAHYAACWELIQPTLDVDELWSTYDFSRARSTRYRQELLQRASQLLDLEETIEGLRAVYEAACFAKARTRGRSTLSFALCKAGRPLEALELVLAADDLGDETDPWYRFHALHAASEVALAEETDGLAGARALWERACHEWLPHDEEHGHPVDFIWRELGVLTRVLGDDPSKAVRLLHKGRECLEKGTGPGPLTTWLGGLLTAHEDWARGCLRPVGTYAERVPEAATLTRGAEALTAQIGPLRALRRVSPY